MSELTRRSPVGEVIQAVKDAIDAGYRHFDCAHIYENEEEVGQAINDKIAEGTVKREDLFITSKLWNTFHDPKEVRGACKESLKKLNLDYLDLYLIHWPMGYAMTDGTAKLDEAGEHLLTNFDLLDTYRAMEELVDAGLTKSIGVSNFNIKQIDYITENARIQPVTNQIECHPYLLNTKLREHCKSKNIVVTAYSPLGSPGTKGRSNIQFYSTPEDRSILREPKLKAIAEKHNKSPAQILIRFQIQLGNVVIPKSITKKRIISNIDVFDFQLTAEDMNDLQNFGYVQRAWNFEIDKAHPEYPFHED
ncbi:aldo-keto reductase family 1 member B1-like [Chironomus tepperi]|uniref:aldo-keto reductase family 1 member B1-like n=1 Tax=Chironomus tepperi TaxID=113505 RepID=UPI00391FB601